MKDMPWTDMAHDVWVFIFSFLTFILLDNQLPERSQGLVCSRRRRLTGPSMSSGRDPPPVERVTVEAQKS